MQLVMNLSVIAILWVGGYKVMEGELQIGELISFVNYLAQVLMSLMLLSMFYHGICPCFGFFTPDYGGLEYYTFFGEYARRLGGPV